MHHRLLCRIEHSIAAAIAYASFMNSGRTTQAEDTAAILQRAAHGGLPVLIPGALEKRAGRSTGPATAPTVQSVLLHAPAAAVDDRERLEHEREGGGAPSARMGRRHGTILAKLGDWLRNGSAKPGKSAAGTPPDRNRTHRPLL
jgi:hypothetical protein